ncbi:hypothetical protein H6P81_006690 [Aristolochia fimbriata]|uniref:Fringe n=1 Tax=Aristolochia fimbriata TaxID=158543 RepID=A0AAV7EZ96_ARIFI|nr:hypothetical protein H6P81_006690 [Aristolochia fimbriata]
MPKHSLGLCHGNFMNFSFLIISLIFIFLSSSLLLTNNDFFCSSTLSADPHTVSEAEMNHEPSEKRKRTSPRSQPFRFDTQLKHVVFAIAASSTQWQQRKHYIKQWWRPRSTRAVVWLDKPVRNSRNEALPAIRISRDTKRLHYSNPSGKRSALSLSRIVSETVRLKWRDVRWIVMGDDDTVFILENLVNLLAKYDHTQYYYIGSNSESHAKNIRFSYQMAYGGGGFAISYPLAIELEKMQDRCLQRYSALYGSDDRVQACLAEIGVPLTREPGFHQYDVYGNLLGLLAAHPVTPLISLHNLDFVEPIFPGMSRSQAIQRLFQSVAVDASSVLQQSICYDRERQWTISVSWGYVVQIIRGLISARELEMPSRTFLNWHKRADYMGYAFNTRPVAKEPCQTPFIFYLKSVRYDKSKRRTISVYVRQRARYPRCRWKMSSPLTIDTIIVLKKQDPLRWQKSPRKDCCRILPSKRKTVMYLSVDKCHDDLVLSV